VSKETGQQLIGGWRFEAKICGKDYWIGKNR